MMMSGLVTKSNTKPPPGIRVDWQVDPIWRGLVGAWFFNEAGGLTANDASGYNGHGTLLNGTLWNGGEVQFDGTNDNIEVKDKPHLRVEAIHQFTVTALVKFSALTSSRGIVAKMKYSSSIGWSLFWHSSGLLSLTNEGVTHQYVSWSPTVDRWYHIAASQMIDKVNYFIDGRFIGSYSNSSAYVSSSTQSLRFGCREDGSDMPFNGFFNHVYLFNRALSTSEVLQLYLNPFPDIRRRVYFVPSVGDITFVAGVGDVLIDAPSVLLAEGLPVGVGDVLIEAPSVLLAEGLPVGADNIVIDGPAITIISGVLVVVGVDSILVDSPAVGLRESVEMGVSSVMVDGPAIILHETLGAGIDSIVVVGPAVMLVGGEVTVISHWPGWWKRVAVSVIE